MHIAHILTRLLRAGSEENTIETCRWQVAAGHQVTLIHGPGHDPYWDAHLPQGVQRIELPQMVHPVRPVQDIIALRQLRALYRQIRPDVIHTHQSKAGILGRLATSAVPKAVVAHGIHIVPFENVSPAKRAIYLAAEKRAARQTDVFIGVSEAVGQSYVDAGVVRRGRVHCVRSGMDLTRFKAPALPNDWRQLLSLSNGETRPKVVLMMAAFEPRKRHVEFLQAFAQVINTLPKTKILLAGRGPEKDRVHAAVAELGLQDHVIFCGHRADPEALFALADISVLTSAREGLPRVVVQSIAAGCPAVVQNVPGLDEIIDHGRNGWIAPAADMKATVAQLQSLLVDAPRLEQLRDGALNTNLSAWALDVLGARTTALYGLPVRAKATQAHGTMAPA